MTWSVSNDLKWVREYINISDGIHIIQEWDWPIGDMNFVAYTDACLSGLGFWIPRSFIVLCPMIYLLSGSIIVKP
jgi:hypothetical protein